MCSVDEATVVKVPWSRCPLCQRGLLSVEGTRHRGVGRGSGSEPACARGEPASLRAHSAHGARAASTPAPRLRPMKATAYQQDPGLPADAVCSRLSLAPCHTRRQACRQDPGTREGSDTTH